MSDIVTLARRHKHVAPTHYEGCEVDHIGCLVNRLADEIEGLRAQLEERYILMRVRQLEHALDAERQTVRRQRAENERLLQAVGLATTTVPDMQVDIEDPVGMMQRVVAEVERLREALRWYADQENHFPVHVHHRRAGYPDPVAVFVKEPQIMDDCGRRARAALEAKP